MLFTGLMQRFNKSYQHVNVYEGVMKSDPSRGVRIKLHC